MGEGSPYLSRATAEIRRPLNDMVLAGQRRSMQLAALIEQLGGTPTPASIQPEEQYLAFLTIRYLLPKLVEAKKRIIDRYERALTSLRNSTADAESLISELLAEHRAELAILQRAR